VQGGRRFGGHPLASAIPSTPCLRPPEGQESGHARARRERGAGRGRRHVRPRRGQRQHEALPRCDLPTRASSESGDRQARFPPLRATPESWTFSRGGLPPSWPRDPLEIIPRPRSRPSLRCRPIDDRSKGSHGGASGGECRCPNPSVRRVVKRSYATSRAARRLASPGRDEDTHTGSSCCGWSCGRRGGRCDGD
jgi:hypothetical protein